MITGSFALSMVLVAQKLMQLKVLEINLRRVQRFGFSVGSVASAPRRRWAMWGPSLRSTMSFPPSLAPSSSSFSSESEAFKFSLLYRQLMEAQPTYVGAHLNTWTPDHTRRGWKCMLTQRLNGCLLFYKGKHIRVFLYIENSEWFGLPYLTPTRGN